MLTTGQWEKKSSIRNRPHRLLAEGESKYFFPAIEQPLCLHPKIIALGEEVKRYILVQSAYLFMKTIFINETEVVNNITNKIINNKSVINFPFETYQHLLTVVIDETYHAYVANDFILQVSSLTGIEPVEMAQDSSLSRALAEVRETVPYEYRLFFEIIALCIAENSITKELISITKDPQVVQLFYQINDDHIVDEGRHCRIFAKILAHLWQEIPEEAKDVVGPLLLPFIKKYLSRDIAIRNDKELLSRLLLKPDEIENIIYDTHPEYSDDNFLLINPIVKNIISLLQKSGVLKHEKTAEAFKNLVPSRNETICPERFTYSGISSNASKTYWPSVIQKIHSWHLYFSQHADDQKLDNKVECQQISISASIDLVDCCALLSSYLQNVGHNEHLSFMLKSKVSSYPSYVPMIYSVNKNSPITEIFKQFREDFNIATDLASFFDDIIKKDWQNKIPLWIDLSDNFNYDRLYPKALQVHFEKSSDYDFVIKIYYQPNFFNATQINELLENFSHYVFIACQNKSGLGKQLPLISPRHRERLLKSSLCTIRASNHTVMSLFQKQVSTDPEQVAIVDMGQRITYLELNTMANNICANLKKMGCSRGAIVAVIHEHSYEYIALILGIMKAGMIFLPLAHDGPIPRLRNILQEAQAKLIVVGKENSFAELSTGFSWTTSKQLLVPDEFLSDCNEHEISQNGLAYIIYTSGSTGVPKGVMITHLSLANLAQSVAKTFPITKHDRVLQFSPYCFDPSLAEIAGSLISGATLCIRTKNMLDTSLQFFSECRRLSISVLNLPTSLWYQLIRDIDSLPDLLPSSLKTVVIGGEAIKSHQLEHWYRHVKAPIKLLNTYGPTETTIAVTACDLGAYKALRNSESLIGSSFAQASLYILDDSFRFLPRGAVGELYVSGPGVSTGYYKRPDLTKERFLLPPEQADKCFSNKGPFYKTGDRVKWLISDQERDSETHLLLAFIDRVDKQVKIRGFRVELGEIEQAINSCQNVASSRALYHQAQEQDYLAAFIVPESSTCISIEKLRSSFQNLLPDYMQPSHIQIIEKWPMTKNGKIDDECLLGSLTPAPISNFFIEEIEVHLATMWQNLLAAKDIISPDSHFLYLGGHSLLAMRLLALINQKFQTKLTLRNILETPRFRQMADLIKEGMGQKTPAPVYPREIRSAPLSFAQEALWVLDQLQNRSSINYNIAYAIHFKNNSNFDSVVLENSLNHVLKRHQILRSVFRHENEVLIQVAVEKNITLQPEFISLSEYKEKALTEARTAFDLEKEPPLRIRLFHIADDYHILFINHHHIIHDGHSIGIFLNELQTCYEAFLQGETPKLPLLNIQYTEYAQWQQNSSDALFADSLDYWCKKLNNYIPLHLPYRILNTKMNFLVGERYRFSMQSATVQGLRMLCLQENCTLFVGLLAIINILFHRDCDTNDITIGSMISTREHQNDEHLIGLFLNTVILRQQVIPGESFGLFLRRVKQTLLEATTHRFVPLAKITQAIKMNRLAHDHSLFDVLVVFHNLEQNFTGFELSNLKNNIEFIDNKTSKFGLTFDVFENEKTLDIEIQYCPALYTFSSVQGIAQRLITLMATIVSNH